MLHKDIAKRDLQKNIGCSEIARKIYLSYPTAVFQDNLDDEFKIKNEISLFFKTPFRNIHVVGSAKTGESFFKGTKFDSTNSDLDIAIIDPQMFNYYMEHVFIFTDNYRNFTGFSSNDTKNSYEVYLSRGIFHPKFMPRCPEKIRINSFFNQLSNTYSNSFKNITMVLYASEFFFESKQAKTIKELETVEVKNDAA